MEKDIGKGDIEIKVPEGSKVEEFLNNSDGYYNNDKLQIFHSNWLPEN